MKRILWICGLPDEPRRVAVGREISPVKTAAWSWIVGHLPPPADVDLHFACPVLGLEDERLDFDWQGAHWHCFRQKRHELVYFWLRVYYRIRSLVKELRPDVIHGWGGETGCGWLATLASRQSVVSVQGLLRLLDDQSQVKHRTHNCGLAGRIVRFIERMSYQRAKICLTESEVSCRELKHCYGRTSVVVAHPLRAAFLTELNSDEDHDGCRIVFVGQMLPMKGPLDLVEAFSRVENHAAKLMMIGDGVDLPKVRELIKAKNLEGRIEIKTSCTAAEVRQMMVHSDLFALPSYGDTGPTALKEALSQGLYPICYDNTGPAELVQKYCGRLTPTGDVEAYACALNSAVRNLDKCRREARVAARCVQMALSPKTIWPRLLEIYSKVVR